MPGKGILVQEAPREASGHENSPTGPLWAPEQIRVCEIHHENPEGAAGTAPGSPPVGLGLGSTPGTWLAMGCRARWRRPRCGCCCCSSSVSMETAAGGRKEGADGAGDTRTCLTKEVAGVRGSSLSPQVPKARS